MLSNICAALEVEPVQSSAPIKHNLPFHLQALAPASPRRAMEEAVTLARVLRGLIRKSQPAHEHPDVLTRPMDALNLKKQTAMQKLANQNKSWFRPPAWAAGDGGDGIVVDEDSSDIASTFTGKRAPPTPLWKLGFTIWMMVLNTFLQAVLCGFMWGYNRFDRPSWATGTFLALGCGVAMAAGLMSWWEGRKVKKIEGPEVQVVQEVQEVRQVEQV
ncbi:hypothetical protein HYQ44_016284 [Verticillium longisporum]|nr:hypothetical protein HYQ44_016284 [Verticillium longisporum]